MVCLDTTVFADLFRNSKKKAVLASFKKLEKNNERLSTTVITISELYHGAFRSKQVNNELQRISEIRQQFNIYFLDNASAEKYGYYKVELEKAGQLIGDRDIFIAAIALANNDNKIMTRNKKHFEHIPDISVLTY